MAIFHCYVSSPEGIEIVDLAIDSMVILQFVFL